MARYSASVDPLTALPALQDLRMKRSQRSSAEHQRDSSLLKEEVDDGARRLLSRFDGRLDEIAHRCRLLEW